MHHAKVVNTADKIHARLKCLQAMSGMTTSARQGGQAFAEGGIQPLDKGGVQHTSPFRLGQHLLGPFDGPLRHAPGDLNHAPFLRVFDHRGDQDFWPGDERASSSSSGSFDLFAEGAPNAARIRRPPVGADQEWSHCLTTAANLGQQAISKPRIASQADDSRQPQPRRDHHGQSHPGRHAPSFDPDLIGLDMHQVKDRLRNSGLMQNLTVMPGSISPTCHGSLIEFEGVDNRLDRAAIREQGDHHHNEFRWLAQPFHHGSTPVAKRVTTAATAIALPLAVMDANGALSDLASCGTRQIWAKLSGRVHWLFCCVLHTPKMPRTVEFFKRSLLFHRLVRLYQR